MSALGHFSVTAANSTMADNHKNQSLQWLSQWDAFQRWLVCQQQNNRPRADRFTRLWIRRSWGAILVAWWYTMIHDDTIIYSPTLRYHQNFKAFYRVPWDKLGWWWNSCQACWVQSEREENDAWRSIMLVFTRPGSSSCQPKQCTITRYYKGNFENCHTFALLDSLIL